MSELFIGLMSGTSVDAIDAVLMDFSESMTNAIGSLSHPIDEQLKNEINQAIAKQTWPQDITKLDKVFAQTSSQAVKSLLEKTSVHANQVKAIGSHGQTIFHGPNETPAISIQIGNAQYIANETGITTISNFRQADIDAGGQGAPLACAYHAQVLQNPEEERVILNLGGIANITKLPKDKNEPLIGFDTGPANTLLDAWISKHQNIAYDKDGVWAKSGSLNNNLLGLLLEDEYFKLPPPKSTGREKFNLIWLQYMLDQNEEFVTEKDVQATLVALTATSITNAIKKWVPKTSRVLLCGGGSNNKFLVSQLQTMLKEVPVEHTSIYGVSEEWMEAMAFAWLAKLKLDGKPGNIPSVTGADKPVELGEIFQPK